MRAEITSIERTGPVEEEILPADPEEIYREQHEKLSQMEITDWLTGDVVTRIQQTEFWRDNSAAGGIVRGGAGCAGRVTRLTDNRTSYYHDQEFVDNPAEYREKHGRWPRVYKEENGKRTVALVMKGNLRDGLGRAQGPYGWSKDRDLVGFAKEATYGNYLAVLFGYFKRPSLPCRDEIKCNNCGSHRGFPSVLNPPISYKFSGIAPAPVHTYVVEISTPTDSKVAFEWWNSNKEKVDRTDKRELKKGDNKVVANITGIPSPPMTGFFNVEVFEAPKGLTIKRVETSPPTSPLGR